MTDHLWEQRRKHAELSNRQFVYFVARRPRLRLASVRPARLIGKHVELRVLKGDAWFPRTIRVPALKRLGQDGFIEVPCDLRTTGDQLNFMWSSGKTATITLFDYLIRVDSDLGLNTTIEYVGTTMSPETRPTNLEHRGLLETAYRTNREREDVVLLFNTFHVRASAASDQFTVMTSNSLMNQLNVRPEAELIEKLLIDYFEPEQQRCSLAVERACLRRFEKDLQKRGIRSVHLVYEVDADSDIYRIGSASVRAARRHSIRRDLRPLASS